MKIKILSAVILLSQLGRAQNEPIKKTLPDFTKLSFSSNTTVYLKKADSPYIAFSEADTSGLKYSVSDGKLVVRDKKEGDVPDKITIGYTQLNEIEVGGAATLKTSETLTTNNLGLNVNGAAKCKMELSVNTLAATVSGAATASLSGAANKLEAIVSGAASLKAEALVAESADVNTSGAATARVNVKDVLTGNASGASTLKFTGDPREVRMNQSGAANVKSLDISKISPAGDTTVAGKRDDKDSARRYTINGRYEIIVHENFKVDTSTVRYKRKHDGRIRKQNWIGIDLFQNGYLTPDNSLTLPAFQDYMSLNYGLRNLGWNLNLVEKDFRFAKGRMQIVTGLGFSFNSYAFKNKTKLNADTSYTVSYPYDTGIDYKKNKLRESFVTVPLLLELNTSRRESRNFHIAAGVIGGLKLGSSTKQILVADNHTYKTVRKDDYNLYPFKLDATVRVGYGPITLFGTYSLTPLFEKGKGPTLYPFTVGIRIIPFD
jgi:hypothetical protein